MCDVNGWSFVKSSHSYHADCAQILRNLIVNHCDPAPALGTPPEHELLPTVGGTVTSDGTFAGSDAFADSDPQKLEVEMLGLIAVIRHGERTPKQKMKMKIDDPELTALFRYGSTRKELKLKSREHLTAVLNATRVGYMLTTTAACSVVIRFCSLCTNRRRNEPIFGKDD